MNFLRDLRFALRLFGKDMGFTVVVTLILAIGIGATTAVFTIANALLLRPFPYRDPQQLVTLQVKDRDKDYDGTLLRYELLRSGGTSFESVAAWATDTLDLTGHGGPVQVAAGRVSPNFFALLGVQPQLGRSFADEEGRPEGKPVVMLSDELWRRRYGGDRSIVSQSITLDGTPHTVVGILPANVHFPFIGEVDVWTPRYFELTVIPPQKIRQGVGYLGMLARLRPQASLAEANAEFAVLNDRYRQQNPAAPDAGPGISVTAAPLRDVIVGGVRPKVWLLFGAVALVLLIACGNVASLLLSRGLARRREIAVRTAVGARRSELLRQLLTESTALSILGALFGVVLAWIAIRALATWGAGQLPPGIPVTMDVSVLLFALVVSLLTGTGFGIAPALRLARTDLQTALREEGRGASAGRSRLRANNLLVVGQMALSLVLLIAAALLLRSYARLLQVEPGFDHHNVLTMNISLPTVKYSKPGQQVAFFDEALRRVGAIPGVRSTAISAALPLSWKRITPMLPQGQPEVPLAQRPFMDIEAVSPHWFQTMRVPLRQGREFTDADNADAPKVLIVNETFARQFWNGDNPVGKQVIVGRWTQPAQVIAVAQDVHNRGLAREPQPQVYIPFAQLPWSNMNLLVRTAVAPESLTGAVRAQISAIDPDQPVTGIQTAEDLMNSSRTQPRFLMLLLVAFSLTALGLAVVGIYGVLAYSVAQRTQELGIRLALGAQPGDILRLILRSGVGLAGVGLAVGFAAALLLTRLLSSLLFRTGPWDAMSFTVIPAMFLLVAVLTSYIPARRATRVSPITVLREQG